MEKNFKKNLHKKSGGYFEVMANCSDSYETLVNRLKLKFPSVSTKQKLSLFRSNGARIVNEKLVVRNTEKPWRLGTYLHFLHVSPEVLRLGIGYDSSSSEDSNSDDEISTAGHNLLDHASIDKQVHKCNYVINVTLCLMLHSRVILHLHVQVVAYNNVLDA